MKTMAQLMRRANELVAQQTALVAEFQNLKLEILQRNRNALHQHDLYFKPNIPFFKREKPE